ncbi:MAG: hypothetical protein U1E39_13285 [Planctomycetota bacterium]
MTWCWDRRARRVVATAVLVVAGGVTVAGCTGDSEHPGQYARAIPPRGHPTGVKFDPVVISGRTTIACMGGGDTAVLDALDAILPPAGIRYSTVGSVWWEVTVPWADAERARALLAAAPTLDRHGDLTAGEAVLLTARAPASRPAR